MIWDVFPFFNELDLLDIRLNVHGPYVDRFVLVECNRTHQGKPKPLHYQDNQHLFEKFHNRLLHVVANFHDTSPNQDHFEKRDAFVNEAEQRNNALRVMADYKDDDIILHSDLDEIFDFRKITKIDCFYQIQMKMYHYYLNVLRGGWDLPQIFRGIDFRNLNSNFNSVRYHRVSNDPVHQPIFKDSGWHFSYMGGPDRIRQKLEAFSAKGFNRAELTNTDLIAERIRNLTDVLCRGPEEGFWLKKVEINEDNHPMYLVQNQKKFAHLIL
jgi:beta-1,4-mannosyl-glycoprotein beta-1,4-N-acetylglucosaminyltransferase